MKVSFMLQLLRRPTNNIAADMLPPRSKRYVGHDGRIPREKTLTVVELITGLLILLALLVLMFPRDSLMSRVLLANINDPLTAAYVSNLLKVYPDNVQLRKIDFEQHVHSLSWQAVRDKTAPMLVSEDLEERHLGASLMLMKIAQETEKTEEMKQLVQQLLHLGLEPGWDVASLQTMIEQALSLSETDMARKMLFTWWQSQPQDPWVWLGTMTKVELGQGRYRSSALLSFVSSQWAKDSDQKKQYFLKGVATLMSGGFYAEVMTSIDLYAGDLLQDEDVLRRLVKVSQAAGQSQRADKYARLLLEMK